MICTRDDVPKIQRKHVEFFSESVDYGCLRFCVLSPNIILSLKMGEYVLKCLECPKKRLNETPARKTNSGFKMEVN